MISYEFIKLELLLEFFASLSWLQLTYRLSTSSLYQSEEKKMKGFDCGVEGGFWEKEKVLALQQPYLML